MLSTTDRNKWILAILSYSLFLGIFNSQFQYKAPDSVFSFFYIFGYSATISVLTGIPAFAVACFYRFSKEKLKTIFIVWTISMIIFTIPIFLDIQNNLGNEIKLPE